jgi:hypothetical protein
LKRKNNTKTKLSQQQSLNESLLAATVSVSANTSNTHNELNSNNSGTMSPKLTTGNNNNNNTNSIVRPSAPPTQSQPPSLSSLTFPSLPQKQLVSPSSNSTAAVVAAYNASLQMTNNFQNTHNQYQQSINNG